jgi:AraC family transcriptional regulator
MIGARIGQVCDRQAATIQHRGGLPPMRLRRVLEYIDDHIGSTIRLGTLAAIVHLSPNHFAVGFKASIGCPPHRYILRRRIAKAKELLADKRIPLAEIAYVLGFPSQAHFTTTFRKLAGSTPGAYRNRL